MLLALVVGLTSVTTQPLMAATPTFSAAKMAQTKVSDLSFKQVVGSILQTGYGSTGTFESQWHVLQLPENDFINVYYLGDAGGDNGGYYEEISPLSYSYESTYQVMLGDSTYFPIKITFYGEESTEDYQGVKAANYSVIKRFSTSSKTYK